MLTLVVHVVKRDKLRETLIANGLDPDHLLGDNSNRVSLGSYDEIRHTLTSCAPSVLRQSAETMMLPIVMSLALHLFCRLQPPTSLMGHGFSSLTSFLILAMFHSFTTASMMLLVVLMLVNHVRDDEDIGLVGACLVADSRVKHG